MEPPGPRAEPGLSRCHGAVCRLRCIRCLPIGHRSGICSDRRSQEGIAPTTTRGPLRETHPHTHVYICARTTRSEARTETEVFGSAARVCWAERRTPRGLTGCWVAPRSASVGRGKRGWSSCCTSFGRREMKRRKESHLLMDGGLLPCLSPPNVFLMNCVWMN